MEMALLLMWLDLELEPELGVAVATHLANLSSGVK